MASKILFFFKLSIFLIFFVRFSQKPTPVDNVKFHTYFFLLLQREKLDKKVRLMEKFQKLKRIWRTIVNDWKTKYRLVFSNEDTLEQRLEIRHITIQKVVVVTVIAVFVLIILTATLIALTPLRVYIPGYTSQKDYKLYRKAVNKIDSLENVIQYNQEYIDHYTAMAKGDVPTVDEMDKDANATPQVHTSERDKRLAAKTQKIIEESEKILGRVQKSPSTATPTIDQAKISNLSIYPPVLGAVNRLFNPSERHYGIDIRGTNKSPVCCVADGVVINTGYNTEDGYYIIVQHPGNLTSIYKQNSKLLKKTGDRVGSGSPIAIVGTSGKTKGKEPHLHFELWYNGFPIDPLDYLVIY